MADKRLYVLRQAFKLNSHGQPANRTWNTNRIEERSIDELMGLCKGLISDRVIVDQEATFLLQWLQANQHALDTWPANVIAARIDGFLDDGKIDEAERADLFRLLAEVVGQTKSSEPTVNTSTALPLTTPAPPIFFSGYRFCLTGRFMLGPRVNIEYEIRDRGGVVQSTVTDETNYLIIGNIGSTDWIHSTHGRKIEKAVALAERGLSIALVSEEHWADHLLQPLKTNNRHD